MLRGSITALITPFANGAVDEKAFAAFVDWQIKEGTHGLVPVGTTGESPTVTPRGAPPRHRDLRRGRRQARAGHRRRRVELDRRGRGARPASPRRSAPTPCSRSCPTTTSRPRKGCSSTSRRWPRRPTLPIILYCVPGRTVVDLTVDTIARLREAHANIVGVKDATASMERASLQRAQARARFHPALGRGHDRARLQRPWRPRLHLGDQQRRAQALRAVPERLPAGQLRRAR